MLTAIIPTHESERALVPTLSALVPGAMQGVVSEVIIADAASTDATAEVANHAGCHLMVSDKALGPRFTEAAAKARAPWLLFLRPGAVPDATWIDDVARFIEESDAASDAAAFRRRQRASRSPMADLMQALRGLLPARPNPQQGLLIAKAHYRALGGHRDVSEPESDLLRRLGRRVVLLNASVR